MNTTKNLHDASAIYFFLLGFIYVLAALSFRNGFMPDLAIVAMRILDVPFAMVALMYGGSSLYLQLADEKQETASPWIMVIFAFCLVLFGAVVFINFAFPSQL
jgi:hypothetical protein